jgi:hypothetical protein
MTNQEKKDTLDNMLICYVDRTNLTDKQIEESEIFVKEIRESINYTSCFKSDSEQLIAFAEWKEYNGKWETHEQQVKNFLKEYKK